MAASLHTIAKKLAAAKCPEDVFGVLETTSIDLKRHDLAGAYRRLILVVHPDRHHGTDHELATSCFRQLEILRDQAEHKISAGRYGDRKPVDPPKVAKIFEPQIIKTPKAEYHLERHVADGDLATVYATSSGFAMKVADHPGDNDLLEHEGRILAALYPATAKDERGYRFLTRLVDSFALHGTSRTLRRCNVMAFAEGHVSLAEILAVYLNGLDYRDVVWIFKRMLYALWFVHRHDVVHGAILPPHVLVHPIGHGAKLVDWCYAVQDWPARKQHVRAISKPYKAWYAPEILSKQPPVPATDIYMAATCAIALLGGDPSSHALPKSVPDPIRAFFHGCLLASPGKRPNDAGALHEEFDDLLLRIVGKPTYRPLAMPEK